MAKSKDIQTAQPVITSLPLPATENPLVIDLPDGQKLVVGKMESGTVIEVATWRGTGRPDSRTSRLMLGMSSGDPTPQASNSSSDGSAGGTPQAGYTKNLGKFQIISNKYLSKIINFMGFGSSKPEDGSTESKQIGSRKSLTFKVRTPKPSLNFKSKKSDSLEDTDFQNWLDSITKKNAKLANFSLDSKNSKVKIEHSIKAEAKTPAKKAAKKAAPKARRSR